MRNYTGILSIVLICIFSNASAGDYLDSLRLSLNSAPDSSRIKIFLELADSLEYTDPVEAEKNLKSAQNLSLSTDNIKLQAKIAHKLGVFYWEKGEYERAMEWDKQALDLFTTINDQRGIASSYMSIGVNLSDLNMQEMAVEELLKAMSIFESIDDKTNLSSAYNILATIYSDMGDNMQALSYLYKAKGLLAQNENSNALADIYHNIANILSLDGDNERAIAFYSRSLDIYEEQDYLAGKSLCLANAADSYIKLGYAVKAENMLIESIEIAESTSDVSTLVFAQNTYAEYLINTGNFQKAKSLLDKSRDACITYHFGFDLASNLKIRSKLLQKTGKHAEAYDVLEAYLALNDSLEANNRLSQIQNMMFVMERDRYDREKERNYTLAEKERLLTQRNKTIYFAGGLIILLLGGLLFSSHRAYRIQNRTAKLLLQKQKMLQDVNARLELEKKESERAIKTKTDFLSMITHELRTPMNAVIGISNILEESNEDPGKKKHLSTLRYSARNLLSLINGILDYNKLDSGEEFLENIDFDLFSLLENIKTALNIEAGKKGLQLQFIHDTHIQPEFCGDPTRITQVLNNLVSNAIKFTDKGFVWVYVEMIKRQNNESECRLKFTVKDTGIGISRENLDRIFEPFQQADSSINRKFGGTGLGLAICKKIVEAMGGSFDVSSEPGLGTTISFEISLQKSNNLEIRREISAVYDPATINLYLQGKKVLVVDDNEINLFVARSILEKNHIKSVVCTSGKDALSMLESGDIDIVLMDLQMPEMDGFETTARIRELKFHQPVIALTAGDKEEMRFGKQQQLFAGFLRKPYETEDLFQIIYKALKDNELQSAG